MKKVKSRLLKKKIENHGYGFVCPLVVNCNSVGAGAAHKEKNLVYGPTLNPIFPIFAVREYII